MNAWPEEEEAGGARMYDDWFCDGVIRFVDQSGLIKVAWLTLIRLT